MAAAANIKQQHVEQFVYEASAKRMRNRCFDWVLVEEFAAKFAERARTRYMTSVELTVEELVAAYNAAK